MRSFCGVKGPAACSDAHYSALGGVAHLYSQHWVAETGRSLGYQGCSTKGVPAEITVWKKKKQNARLGRAAGLSLIHALLYAHVKCLSDKEVTLPNS